MSFEKYKEFEIEILELVNKHQKIDPIDSTTAVLTVAMSRLLVTAFAGLLSKSGHTPDSIKTTELIEIIASNKQPLLKKTEDAVINLLNNIFDEIEEDFVEAHKKKH